MSASNPPKKTRLLSPKDRLAAVEQKWRDRGSPMDDTSVQNILGAYNYVSANKDRILEYPAILDRYIDFLERVTVEPDSMWQCAAIGTLINFYAGKHIIPFAETLTYSPISQSPNYDRVLELIDLPKGPIYARYKSFYRGHIHFAKGDYANARAAYHENPNYLTSPEATFNMAVSCEKLGPDFAEDRYLVSKELLRRYGDRMNQEQKSHTLTFIADYLGPERLRASFIQAGIDHPERIHSMTKGALELEDTAKLYDQSPVSAPAPGKAA